MGGDSAGSVGVIWGVNGVSAGWDMGEGVMVIGLMGEIVALGWLGMGDVGQPRGPTGGIGFGLQGGRRWCVPPGVLVARSRRGWGYGRLVGENRLWCSCAYLVAIPRWLWGVRVGRCVGDVRF